MSLLPPGAVLTLKKNHPCGSREWKVIRAGWEYSLQCCGCGHIILMRRDQLQKKITAVQKKGGNSTDNINDSINDNSNQQTTHNRHDVE
jgi:hypothetical protein